ncbi:MAG TPA: hypothetical protein VM681_06325 [Candidatus Thermoplasmatota archaeon]|nr:hypothetical protein [Candidatus Thermoplasmatota archaeon]
MPRFAILLAALSALSAPAWAHGGGDVLQTGVALAPGEWAEIDLRMDAHAMISYAWRSTPAVIAFDLHSHNETDVVRHANHTGTNFTSWFAARASGLFSMYWLSPPGSAPTQINVTIVGDFECASSSPGGLCAGSGVQTDDSNPPPPPRTPAWEAAWLAAAVMGAALFARRRGRGRSRSP